MRSFRVFDMAVFDWAASLAAFHYMFPKLSVPQLFGAVAVSSVVAHTALGIDTTLTRLLK